MRARHTVVLLVLPLVIAAGGCGGDGDNGPSEQARQSQAKAAVCSARGDINAQVTTLQGLEPELKSVPQVTTAISAIVSDLGKIKDAQSDLDPDAKEQVQQANERFAEQAKAVSKAAVSGGLSGDVSGQLGPAIDELAQTYADVLKPIEC